MTQQADSVDLSGLRPSRQLIQDVAKEMKNMTAIMVLAFSMVVGTATVAQEEPSDGGVPLCPMTTKAKKDGLFQLVVILGPDGDTGFARPGDTVRLKCTIVNCSDRAIMVAEDQITPQCLGMDVRTDDPEEFLQTIPEAERSMAAAAMKAIGDGIISSGPFDLPKGSSDWGFVRRWIQIAAGGNAECACGLRHREFSKTIDFRLPEEMWTSITLSLSQRIPAILLGPEEHVTLKSKLEFTIKRKNEANNPAQTDGDKPGN